MRWAALSLVIVALILIPFALFGSYFEAIGGRILRGEFSTWTTAAVIFGLLGSDVLLPIPSSIVSAAAGSFLGFWRGAAVVWSAMTVSCLIGYAVGSRSARAATRFVGTAGIARAASLAEQYGDLAIALCRPVPVLAEASVIVAGLVRAPLVRFFWITGLSNLGVALAYAAIGAYSMRVESFLLGFLGAIAFPGFAFLVARLWLGRGVRVGERLADHPPDRE